MQIDRAISEYSFSKKAFADPFNTIQSNFAGLTRREQIYSPKKNVPFFFSLHDGGNIFNLVTVSGTDTL